MAKAILEFDLNDPDDVIDHLKAAKANEAFIVIREIQNNIRSIIKYKDIDDNTHEIVENIRNDIQGYIDDYNLNIN